MPRAGGRTRVTAGVAAFCLVAGFLAGMHSEDLFSFFRYRTARVSFAGPHRMTLSGKIYYPPSIATRKYPGILLCHGTLPDGKDTELYVTLAKKLAMRGFLVLTFDLRGFGKSLRLSPTRSAKRLDFVADVNAALDYMLRELPVDKDTITVAGHSLGANLAFAVGSRDVRVRNIIPISTGNFPPVEKLPPAFSEDYRVKLEKATGIAVPRTEWKRLAAHVNAFQYLPIPPWKNVLIVVGDGDVSGVFNYNRRLYAALECGKDLLVIPDSNHNFGFERYPGNKRISDPPLRLLADGIDDWLSSLPAPKRER